MKRKGIRPLILMLSGKAGVGKTTSALLIENIIQDHYPEIILSTLIGSFAKTVKQAAYDVFGWRGEKDKRGRDLLIAIGNGGRAYNEDLWVNKFRDDILEGYYHGDLLVIDDWRYPNERDVLSKGAKVYTVRIYAPNRESLKSSEAYNDISETSLSDNPSDYDFFIDNQGDFDQLRFQLLSILNTIVTAEEQE